MEGRVVYLTGSTGFLGGMLVRFLQKDPTVSKIYCPIRNKKGMTGPERLKKSVGDFDKCEWVKIDGPVPADATHVILNAYNTRFDATLQFKLEENVVPILKIMDDINSRKTPIQGITFVSTAFVLPPLPFKCPKGGKLPLLLDFEGKNKMTPTQVYEEALKGTDMATLYPDLHWYYKENSYVFSKHILEHLLIEKYPKLPICVVRPSLILPSKDLTYGYQTKSAVPLLFQLCKYPVFLAPCCEGRANLCFIEEVTQDCMDGAFELAKPAAPDETGTKWHQILQAVGHSEVNSMVLFKSVAPEIPRFDIRTVWLRNMVRQFENLWIRAVFGEKKARLLVTAYENYDFFMSNTWGFEPRQTPDIWKVAVDGGNAYYKEHGNPALKVFMDPVLWFWAFVSFALMIASVVAVMRVFA